CRWDRATPSTLAMVFIGKRPSAATRAASSVFCLCLGESLLEDFHLHGLTAEKALQLADPLLEPTNLGVADHRFIRAHSCPASLRHQTAPSVEKVRRHAMPPCHRGDRFPRLAARLDDPKLLFRRPASPTRRSSDQFNSLIVVRHRHVLEDIPKPSELGRVSGRNGGQFSTIFAYRCPQTGVAPLPQAACNRSDGPFGLFGVVPLDLSP